MTKRRCLNGLHGASALAAKPKPYLQLSAGVLLLLASACDDAKNKKESEPSGAALAKPAISAVEKPAPTPAAPAVPTPAPEAKASRPTKIDFTLSDERRADVEKAYPDAKGFLTADSLEEKLKAKKVTSVEPALKAFDGMAKGKWILVTGTMVNLTETGFDLGITYTPQLPGDPMGMSRQWFPVTFSNVEGYSKGKFKLGDSVVVLAKYTGGKKAGPGYELVDQQHWK